VWRRRCLCLCLCSSPWDEQRVGVEVEGAGGFIRTRFSDSTARLGFTLGVGMPGAA
jgi:hypothetical protein